MEVRLPAGVETVSNFPSVTPRPDNSRRSAASTGSPDRINAGALIKISRHVHFPNAPRCVGLRGPASDFGFLLQGNPAACPRQVPKSLSKLKVLPDLALVSLVAVVNAL